MDNYIKTIINGLKTWVSSCLSRLETSVSESLEVAEKAQATATNAQTTANEAKTTANEAKTTANEAKTTANEAKTTANEAKTTANEAQTTANEAQTTASKALPKSGGTMTGPLTVIYNASGQDYSNVTIKPTLKNRVPVVRIEGGGRYDSTIFENYAILDHIQKIILCNPSIDSGKEYELSVDENGNLTLDGGENPAQIGPSDEKINQMIAQSIKQNRVELNISGGKLPDGMTAAELFELLEEKDVFVYYGMMHCKIVTWQDYGANTFEFLYNSRMIKNTVADDGTLTTTEVTT